VILSEPPRTAYDVHFRLFGVPVRIHPLFWLMTICLAGFDSRPSEVAIWLAAVLISITIHEMGHVLAFRRFGVDAYIVLHSFGGLAIPTSRGDYGWASPTRLAPLQRAIVSFAGPAVQIFSALVLLGGLYLSGVEIDFPRKGILQYLPYARASSDLLRMFANDYFYISIFWALVNLLPIIPLDGGQISQVMFEGADPHTGTRQALYISMIVAGLTAALMLLDPFKSIYMAIFFVYLAYMNYQNLAFISSNGRRW
jgi:stage IV sporulation protein FB